APPRHGVRAGALRPRRAPLAGTPGRPPRRRQGQTGRHAAVHGRHWRPPPRRRPRDRVDRHRRTPRPHSQPGARTRARPSQPHRPPARLTLIAAGFVATPRSAPPLGDELKNRRNQLRATLPIRRVVVPADVAALAVHLMTNTALTGATYDIDGGQQLVAG